MPQPIFDERYKLARAAANGSQTTWETGGERLVRPEAAIELVAEQTRQIDIRYRRRYCRSHPAARASVQAAALCWRPAIDDFHAASAHSKSACVPTTLVRTKVADETIERSTWFSAAKCTTRSKSSQRNSDRQPGVTDVALDELELCISLHCIEIGSIACIGKRIQHDD
jgi:hypothetical protein